MRYQWGYAVGHEYTHSSGLQVSLTPGAILNLHGVEDSGVHGGQATDDRPSPIPSGPDHPMVCLLPFAWVLDHSPHP
jgi:hypothetical protein